MRQILCCLLLVICMQVYSENLSYDCSQSFEILESSEEKISLIFTNPEFTITDTCVNGVTFNRLSNQSAGVSLQPGFPELLHYSVLLGIDNKSSYSVRYSVVETTSLDNINVYPAQGVIDTDKQPHFNYRQDYYIHGITKEYNPLPDVKIGEPAIMRDCRLVNLTVSPFSYDQQNKRLVVNKTVKIEIYKSGSNGVNQLTSNRSKSRAFENLLQDTVLNYRHLNRTSTDFQQRSIVMVYPNNDDLEEEVEMYLEWKRNKGFHVVAARVGENGLGSSSSSVKAYIQNLYNTAEIPPEYVIIVGDASGTFNIGAFGNGDHEYTMLDGTDLLPEVFIGRLSISSVSDMSLMLSKMNQYERDLSLNQNPFNHSLLAGDTDPSGLSCVLTCKNAKDLIKQYDPDHNFTEIYQDVINNSNMNSVINGGVNFFVFRGYLRMSGWDGSYINSLLNSNMLANGIVNTCSTGTFTSETSHTEHMIRVGTPSSPKGFLTAIGLATSGTHTQMNNCMTNGTMHGLYKGGLTTMGEAIMRGKLSLYNTYWNVSNSATKNFTEWNNLMGDPTIDIWKGPINPMTVVHDYDNGVPAGKSEFEILVKDADDNPIEDAWVTIRNEESFASGYTNELGEIILETGSPLLSEASLVVTKPQYYVKRDTLTIDASGMVIVQSCSIEDGTIAETSGNSDGIMNPGEKVNMKLTFKNHSQTPSLHPIVKISTDNQYVNIINNTDDIDNLYINSIEEVHNGFSVFVSDQTPEDESVKFNIEIIDDNNNVLETEFRLSVQSQPLDIDFSYTDQTDGKLHRGQTNNLIVNLINSNSQLSNVYCKLLSNSTMFYIEDNESYIGNIAASDSASNYSDPFEVYMLNTEDRISEAEFELQVYNYNGLNITRKFKVDIAQLTVNNTFTGPDEYGYIVLDENDVFHEYAPTYNWIEIDTRQTGSLPGTDTGIIDNGNHDPVNGINNMMKFFDMPFDFSMYGVNYDVIGICSHGYVTFENTGIPYSEQVTFRNYMIPDAAGPSPMIAAFWEDIFLGSTGKVFYYEDTAQHYFVIEWSNLKSLYDNVTETFQMIIYDEEYYPTPTGDNNVKVQYKVFNNSDDVFVLNNYPDDPFMGNYCSVGMESHDEVTGILYTYNNEYSSNSMQLGNNKAIMFTTLRKESQAGIPRITDDFVVETGSSNGTVDAGESLDITLNLSNTSAVDCQNLAIAVTTDNSGVTVNNGAANLPVILPEGGMQFTFDISTAASMQTGDSFTLNVEITTNQNESLIEKITYSIGQSIQESAVISGSVSFADGTSAYENVNIKCGRYANYANVDSSYEIRVKNGSYDAIGRIQNYPKALNADVSVSGGVDVANIDLLFNSFDVPQNITGSASGGTANLTWLSIDSDRTDFIKYRIFKQTSTDEYRLYATTTDTVFTESISANTTYRYCIAAQYEDGVSVNSDAVAITGDTGTSDSENVNYVNTLGQNYPNPFNPVTTIAFSLKESSHTTVKVYNIKGEVVNTLINENLDAGQHVVKWNGDDSHGKQVGSGVYFYRMKSDSFDDVKKAILLK